MQRVPQNGTKYLCILLFQLIGGQAFSATPPDEPPMCMFSLSTYFTTVLSRFRIVSIRLSLLVHYLCDIGEFLRLALVASCFQIQVCFQTSPTACKNIVWFYTRSLKRNHSMLKHEHISVRTGIVLLEQMSREPLKLIFCIGYSGIAQTFRLCRSPGPSARSQEGVQTTESWLVRMCELRSSRNGCFQVKPQMPTNTSDNNPCFDGCSFALHVKVLNNLKC